MLLSLKKIISAVDNCGKIPREWEKMQIKSIHKKGAKTKMSNKRGLFLTNNISKVYERILKERNEEKFGRGISEWQTGGIKRRSTIDNVMTVLAVIERNQYLRKNTYVVFTDAEKCFDQLWLQDGVHELWRCGVHIRDCMMIRKLNETARIVIKTPVGDCEEIEVKNIVKQGTVYGPPVCNATTDRINNIGGDTITHYGPYLQIRAMTYVDDITGATANVETVNRIVDNCGLLEEKKKMVFNNKNGKSEYLVVLGNKKEIRTGRVKKGRLERVGEHKMLGTWFDNNGKFKINIEKRQQKLQFMINTIKGIGSAKNVGMLAVETRLKLGATVIIPCLLYNAEAYPSYTKGEIDALERIQADMLKQFLELPKSTSYYGILMQTGIITMKAKLAYKKLMLFHNIMHSDERRIIKKIILYQMEEGRKNTWNDSVCRLIEEYSINLKVEEVSKSVWKKEVKSRIRSVDEEEIREQCRSLKKTRSVQEDSFQLQPYLSELSISLATDVAKARLHMCKVPGNYKTRWAMKSCPLCGAEETATEHYFTCNRSANIAEIYEVNSEDLKCNNTRTLVRVAKFIEKVEKLLSPKLM